MNNNRVQLFCQAFSGLIVSGYALPGSVCLSIFSQQTEPGNVQQNFSSRAFRYGVGVVTGVAVGVTAA